MVPLLMAGAGIYTLLKGLPVSPPDWPLETEDEMNDGGEWTPTAAGVPPERILWVLYETTPHLNTLYSGGVPAHLADLLRTSVSFPSFYTTDVRPDHALRGILTTPGPDSWIQALKKKGYVLHAVGAWSETQRTDLLAAGFDRVQVLPWDGNDGVRAAQWAARWQRTGTTPLLTVVYFRDFPPGRWPPRRYVDVHWRRFPLARSAWMARKRAAAAAYFDDALGILLDRTELLNPLVCVTSLHGSVRRKTPIRGPDARRRLQRTLPELAGLRESEIRVLFSFRHSARWAAGLYRASGSSADFGPTLLKAVFPRGGVTVPGKAWAMEGASTAEAGEGAWAIDSAQGKALIVDGRYKYVRHRSVAVRGGWTDDPAEEVFDLWDDPRETRNLADERRPLLLRLRDVMQEVAPDPVEWRVTFANPTAASFEATLQCVGGKWRSVRGSIPWRSSTPSDVSLATTATAGEWVVEPWPPSSPFRMTFSSGGKPLPADRVRVSRWALPLLEPADDEWFDHAKFGWMDGWGPCPSSTATVVCVGRRIVWEGS